jgi:hypothetical protein
MSIDRPESPSVRRCPECGAELGVDDERCWLCRRDLVIDAELVETPKATGQSPFAAVHPLQFSLETLLLIVTLSAVCLGALVAAPGLGVLALVIAVPALIRTCLTGISSKRLTGKLTVTDKIMAFLASAAITWAALVAAGIAFFAACTVSVFAAVAVGQAQGSRPIDNTLANLLIWTAVVFCGVVSIGAFAGIFWLTWPKRQTGR